MRMSLMAGVLVGLSTDLFAAQYDDAQYLFRGIYNHQGDLPPAQAVVEDYEFYNAMVPAEGRWQKPNHYSRVFGDRNYVRPVISDVVNPLTGRVLKNRSTVRFLQTTYKNPGDDTLYGYANYIDATMPFPSAFENNYTILVRFKHEGKICPESTQSCLYNFGYGYSGNCGLWVSLKGDDDNQYPYVYLGRTFATEFKATQNSPETRLSAGKWTDLVISRGGNSFTIYTLAEGGQICKQTATGSATSTQTSSWFRLGTGADSGYIDPTNVVIATHAGRNNFRGSVERVAVWQRMLTDDEVKAAMADDFGDGDALRFGVANDSEKEFTGTNYLGTVFAMTVTDADQSTDWRHFVNNLSPANPTATVKFTVPAEGFVYDRQLEVKLTSASAAGATLSATLNGTALLTNAAAEPGTTLTAEVLKTVLKVGDNELVFTRTDAGTIPLYFDCFAIVGVTETDSGDYRGAKVPDDIYASAWAWWKRPTDLNGNGKPDANSYELPNALFACDALKNHAIHTWAYNGHPSGIAIQNQTVTYPASGVTLENESCLYFAAPTWKSGGTDRFGRADLYKDVFVISNTGNYAFTTRIKIKEWLAPETGYNTAQVFGVGYGWSADTGVGLSLCGTGVDGDNLFFVMANGRSSAQLKGTQTADPADRICTNKWIDIAVVLSNGYERVYTFVEGGTQLVEQGGFTIGGTIPTSSRLVLGLNGTTGSSDVEGSYPDQFRGWMHSCAIWPRALTRDEVLRVFKYPQLPDLVTVGVADGTVREFKTGITVDTWTPPANGDYDAARPNDLYTNSSYTVNFTIPAEQAGRNQLFRLSTLDGSDPTAKISIELNGETIVNYPAGSLPGVSEFLPDADGVYEIGIRREKIAAGAATLKVEYVSGAYPIVVDALSLGNGDRFIKVRTGLGVMLLVR